MITYSTDFCLLKYHVLTPPDITYLPKSTRKLHHHKDIIALNTSIYFSNAVYSNT